MLQWMDENDAVSELKRIRVCIVGLRCMQQEQNELFGGFIALKDMPFWPTDGMWHICFKIGLVNSLYPYRRQAIIQLNRWK